MEIDGNLKVKFFFGTPEKVSTDVDAFIQGLGSDPEEIIPYWNLDNIPMPAGAAGGIKVVSPEGTQDIVITAVGTVAVSVIYRA